jgi:hypothetical protein
MGADPDGETLAVAPQRWRTFIHQSNIPASIGQRNAGQELALR